MLLYNSIQETDHKIIQGGMSMKKKIVMALLACMISSSLILTSCGQNAKSVTTSDKSTEKKNSFSEDDISPKNIIFKSTPYFLGVYLQKTYKKSRLPPEK